jgi:hypothetical protein
MHHPTAKGRRDLFMIARFKTKNGGRTASFCDNLRLKAVNFHILR